MSYSVLIVEDSSFFQGRLKEIINESQELNVIGIATNGQEAIDMTAELKPDIISMDYEMPLLDGVSAVRVIMSETPTPIVMFSSMTFEGARITLDALEAGALDFMNKNFAEVSADSASFKKKFHEKLINFARDAKAPRPNSLDADDAVIEDEQDSSSSDSKGISSSKGAKKYTEEEIETLGNRPSGSSVSSIPKGKVKLVVIGASTGGPIAVSQIIASLPSTFPIPILVIQHMPENFTRAFSERLDRNTPFDVREAQNGSLIESGKVLVAPGGKQMMIHRSGEKVKIVSGDDRVTYRPSVDITFASAATVFEDGVLGIVLTGMGSDGCEGARLLKARGSAVWSQDEESCVVYGMPAAVVKEDISSCVLPLGLFAQKMSRLV